MLINTCIHLFNNFISQAITGGRLNFKDCEAVRMIIVKQMDEKNMFAVWRFSHLWQSVTKKGQGQRMGGGKGAIDHYVFPFRAERIILEMGGHCEFVEVFPVLKAVRILSSLFILHAFLGRECLCAWCIQPLISH